MNKINTYTLSILLFTNVCNANPQDVIEHTESQISIEMKQTVEVEVSNVAEDYNNSRSTPLARHEDYLYWVYVAKNEESTPTEYFIQLHQISIPENRETSSYSKISHDFINNYGETNHELRVFDGTGQTPLLDKNHTAPSVGVDKEGYIHVVGGVHHSQWEYCISKNPNDISEFECPTENTMAERLPPNSRPSYPRFIKHPNGSLYLTYRGKFSAYWYNGTSYGALALYDEPSRTWTALGGNNYTLGNLLDQQAEPEEKAENFDETGHFTLPIAPKWLSGGSSLPETQTSLFYSATGAYHRYYREPNTGIKDENHDYNNVKHAYQAYWTDIKIGLDGRIHAAAVVKHSPIYDINDDGADNEILRIVQGSEPTDPEYQYTEKSYVNNYDHASSILYAYSDDNGKTFHAPNGDILDTPISPEPLSPLYGVENLRSASIENGAIVYTNKSATIKNKLSYKLDIALPNNENPIIHFREYVSNGNAGPFLKGKQWIDNNWKTIENNRIKGAAGGITSDGTGTLWAFESYNSNEETIPLEPTSSGNKILYSKSGIEGPWEEIESEWSNGLRIDSFSANTSNVIRYVDMDIQRGGTARIISISTSK